MEQLAEVARVGDDVGRGEEVKGRVCRLERAEEGLKSVRVPREGCPSLEGRVVPV